MEKYRYRQRDKCNTVDLTDASNYTVTIVGVGGVGSRVAEILCREGFNVRLVDKAKVMYQDLHRCTLFDESDLDSFKVKAAKKHLKRINRSVVVKAFDEYISEETRYLIQGDFLIVSTSEKEVHSLAQAWDGTAMYAYREADSPAMYREGGVTVADTARAAARIVQNVYKHL